MVRPLPLGLRACRRGRPKGPRCAMSCTLHRVGRGARQQQHEIGMLGARRPDLLAVDDVVIAVAHRRGAQAERVGAGGRLGDAEGLQAQFAARDAGQVARLLFGAAVTQQRAHRVHLRVAGGAVAAGRLDLFHDGDGRAHGQPAAAVLFGDQGGEKAGLGQRRDEFVRIGALAIERRASTRREMCDAQQRAHRPRRIRLTPQPGRWPGCPAMTSRVTIRPRRGRC